MANRHETTWLDWDFIPSRASFAEGWLDYGLGIGFGPAYEKLSPHEQEAYERGRQFAAAAPHITRLHLRKRATKEVIATYKALRQAGAIL